MTHGTAKTDTYHPLPGYCRALAAATPESVLLETTRYDEANFRSYLFLHPRRVLAPGAELLAEIERAQAEGCYVAGYLGYECGEGLRGLRHGPGRAEPGITGPAALPPAWFGVYRDVFVFDHRSGCFQGRVPEKAPGQAPEKSTPSPEAAGDAAGGDFAIHDVRLDIGEGEYAEKIAAIHEYIRAGDTYQVNFTSKLRFGFSGSPAGLFAALGEGQAVSFGALLHGRTERGEGWHILSLSPELFFRLRQDRIVTRPVKGTVRRGRDAAEDEELAGWLREDSKSRSENVMIVDLLRNDLGRICEYGSIRVEELFTVERYETLLQMVSEISGRLRPDAGLAEIFEALFPCGSVTGAPKHRTMEIIDELESSPRGVYTGAIGFFSPQREAVFSVPIRTIALAEGTGEMGVGSGIVIDSRAGEEYRECLLKAEFLTRRRERFQLIESILWDGGYGELLPLHLDRIEASARYFGFRFDRAAIVAALDAESATMAPGARSKLRLLLDRSGVATVTHGPAPRWPEQGRALLSACPVDSADRFLRHKTTRRQLYDAQYARAREQGYDEVLFVNEHGELTEGAISNLIVEIGGRWWTPPVECGLLSGVYRRYLLESGRAAERVLHPGDLASADAVYLCNAVRGCGRISVAEDGGRNVKSNSPE